MRTVRRLRLRFLLLRPGSPNPTGFTFPCCPLCYSLPCRNHDWPIKNRHENKLIPKTAVELSDKLFSSYLLLVDQAGVEPASRTLFSLLHTAITYIVYLFGTVVNRAICPNNRWCQSDARCAPHLVVQWLTICRQIFSSYCLSRIGIWHPALDHCTPRYLCC